LVTSNKANKEAGVGEENKEAENENGAADMEVQSGEEAANNEQANKNENQSEELSSDEKKDEQSETVAKTD